MTQSAAWTTVLRRARIVVSLSVMACDVSLHSCFSRRQSSGGDVSHNWRPRTPDGIMGVPASALTAAINQRLSGSPPAPITADQWKHTKKLYATYQGAALWLTRDGLNNDRVQPLLRSLAAADSDALRLDLYPLSALDSA